MSISKGKQSKVIFEVYLRPQSSYDGRESQAGDECKDAKEVMLLLPGCTQVEYGEGRPGQVQGAKDASHQK